MKEQSSARNKLAFAVATASACVIWLCCMPQARAQQWNCSNGVCSTTGNVGIGAPIPNTQLTITNTGAGESATYLDLKDTGAGGRDYLVGSTNNSNGLGGGLFAIYDNTASAARIVINPSGNVGIGKTNPSVALDVVGNISATGSINATYQDVAEWVPSSQKLSAGTVVVLDTSQTNHVLASTKAYDTGVAGVVSASPGVILGEGGGDKVKVATTGRVKVKADATRAPIGVGDLLVTGEVEGVAMKSIPVDLGGTQIHRPGTIIGKALEPLEKGTGEILVLLSLQ